MAELAADHTAEVRATDACGTTLERVAAALGYSTAVFTEGAPVEPLLAETAELLRLWSRVQDPAAAQRILVFVAAVVAGQA